jgi:hypothetical protein
MEAGGDEPVRVEGSHRSLPGRDVEIGSRRLARFRRDLRLGGRGGTARGRRRRRLEVRGGRARGRRSESGLEARDLGRECVALGGGARSGVAQHGELALERRDLRAARPIVPPRSGTGREREREQGGDGPSAAHGFSSRCAA